MRVFLQKLPKIRDEMNETNFIWKWMLSGNRAVLFGFLNLDNDFAGENGRQDKMSSLKDTIVNRNEKVVELEMPLD